MEYHLSLSRRIVIAFVLMTFLVGGVFALGIVAAVHTVEERLISTDLHNELERMVQRDMKRGGQPVLDPDMRLYFVPLTEVAQLPAHLRELPAGFSEVEEDQQYFYAYVAELEGNHFVLLQNQSDFEARERLLYKVVLVGFLISVALAWLLGWALARRVIAPVVRLARQVRRRDQLLDVAPPLAPDYAKDEVGELAGAFDDALERLRAALARERLFTSDVSHELRTPLMVINSSCELLEATPDLPARAKGPLERMTRAAREMQELVQTFLALARNQGDNDTQAPRATLADVARRQTQEWQAAVQAKGLQWQLSVAPGTDQGLWHEPFLRSVMSNLLRNALHYTERGYIGLHVGTDGFVVEDSGVGIPEEQREAMFQPFVRGAEGRGEGLGLGLSLVRRICQLQGWHVTLGESAAGGCRFEIALGTDRLAD
ncbi:sensor histidine kinase [Pseudomonas oryzihabitans]|uniref:sensor histidine kinase n=1 Tax=Pseudomonas oryzihabitans TaxID=47885 RepID=UPI0021DAF5D2|nr:HAMP domain-containing sensor histidine kinase [Pseudomonas oryzihabitans]